MKKIASFDIFDTTLLRKCGSPEAIFRLLAVELYPADDQQQATFFKWRIQAESSLRQKKQTVNATLADIYQANGCPSDAQKAMELECRIEAEQLAVNPAILDIIQKKRQQGFTIVFISDMYLSSTLLKQVLTREGCMLDDDYLYISCEHHARKDDGSLYDIVKKELHPNEWEHWGDNIISDNKTPKKKGIRTFLIKETSTPEEVRLRKMGIQNWMFCILSGHLRYLRLTHKKQDARYLLALNYLAPVYLAYMTWVIRKAKEKNISKLLFLSRDGYILKKIAEVIPHDGIALHDLFVSRKALLPAYQHQQPSRQQLTDYLKQEGVTEEQSYCGMVDLGWYGSTRQMLNTVLREEGCHDTLFFYYGIREDALPMSEGLYMSFMGAASEETTFATHLLEQYFSASPYPSTIGYQKKGGRTVPVFKDGKQAEDTPLTLANTAAACELAQLSRNLFMQLSDEQLVLLAKVTIEGLLKKDCNIDISPLLECEPIDDRPFVKKLSTKEIWRWLTGECTLTAYDRLSTRATFSPPIYKPLWFLHCVNSRLSKLFLTKNK